MSCNGEALRNRRKDEDIIFSDSLGPFHDETILSSIDRVLYFLGVQKLLGMNSVTTQHSVSSTCNFKANKVEPLETRGSNQSLKKSSKESIKSILSKHSIRSLAPEAIAQSVRFLNTPAIREIICPICGSYNEKMENESKLESLLNKMDTYQENPLASTLRKSFSLCSLACRKIRKGLSTSSFSLPKNSKWFWTRRREQYNHQIFEIYRNSDMDTQPSRSRLRKNLAMILVITPTGAVVPFEPVKNHF